MKIETLNEANKIDGLIKQTKKRIEETTNQKATWIDFSHGNGSDRSVVCNDPEIIEEIRALLIHKYNVKLQDLKKEFDNLSDV